MLREADLSGVRRAALSSGVRIGFVIGALIFVVSRVPNRYDPCRVFTISAFLAGAANLVLMGATPGGALPIAARVTTGRFWPGSIPWT